MLIEWKICRKFSRKRLYFKLIYFDSFTRPKVIQGICEVATRKIDILSEIWNRLFEPEIGDEHMNMLIKHVEDFFTEIIVETQNREKAIRDRINSEYWNLSLLSRITNEFPLFRSEPREVGTQALAEGGRQRSDGGCSTAHTSDENWRESQVPSLEVAWAPRGDQSLAEGAGRSMQW